MQHRAILCMHKIMQPQKQLPREVRHFMSETLIVLSLLALSVSCCNTEPSSEVESLKVCGRASRAASFIISCVVIWHIVSFGQKYTDRPLALKLSKDDEQLVGVHRV